MAVLNYTGEELNAKIVYYGPGLSGKTTNLEYIHSHMPVSVKGQMVSMKTRTDRTLFFDFLPIDFGDIGGCRTRFLLYTVPGQVYYNATRKLVLKGVDAVVFVADSGRDKLVENLESLRNLEDNLNELGMTLDEVPWVIQYNKRDLPDAMPVQELEQRLNLLGVPAFEGSAVGGEGVFETFQGVAKLLYHDLKHKLERGEVTPPTQASDPMSEAMAQSATPAGGEEFTAVDDALRETPRAVPHGTPRTNPVGRGAGSPAPRPQDHDLGAREPERPASPRSQAAPTPQPPAAAPAADSAMSRYRRMISEVRGEEPDDRVQAAGSPVPRASAQPAASTRAKAPAPTAVEEPDEGDQTQAPMFEAMPDAGLDAELGRTIEFDEHDEPTPAPEPPREFITDPAARPKPRPKAPAKAPTPPAKAPAKAAPRPVPVPEAPRPTPPPPRAPEPARAPSAPRAPVAEAEAEAMDVTELHVPVRITRSQVRRAVPVRLVLEIQVVED